MSNDKITDPAAQMAEGDRYYNGDDSSAGVKQDFAQAAAWYEKAESKIEDTTEAIQWLERAANEHEHEDAEVIWEAKWRLAEIYEYGLYNIAKDLDKAKNWYEQLVDIGDESAAVYVKLLSQGKEDPIHSRGWEIKHLVSRTLADSFPEFDAVSALYEKNPDYSDVEDTDEEKKACIPIAEKILMLADLVQRESILALAQEAEKEEDIYLKTALKLAADGIRAELFDEVFKVLFRNDIPTNGDFLRWSVIHRGIYLLIKGDITPQKLKILLGSLYVPQLLMPKNTERKYKMTFNYLLTHRQLPEMYFEELNMFYTKILPYPEMMERFLFFAYNRSKYFATEYPDIEPAFEVEKFDMHLYEGTHGRNILVITFPKCDIPPESYQIAIPTICQKARYFTCELSVNPMTNVPCFIFGEWTPEMKHTNHGIIEMKNENSFAEMAMDIAYGKALDKLPFNMENMEFDTPTLELYCEKCETTNYFYEDNKPPYICDCCGAELKE